MNRWILAALTIGAGLAACAHEGAENDRKQARQARSAATRDACSHRDSQRQAFFGDFHVHTGLSMDARNVDTRLSPDDAYRFARGEPIGLPPHDADGRGLRTQRLARPLDFAALTDHSEFLAEVAMCTRAGTPGYESPYCQRFRGAGSDTGADMGQRILPLMRIAMDPNPRRDPAICGEDGEQCLAQTRNVWQETIAANERWNDTSSECRFTTFVAYEYSAHTLGANLHRNVIFRNADVPETPTSYVDAPTPQALWRALRDDCLEAGTGCDVLAIPHNSNISKGRMFELEYPGANSPAEQAEQARLRGRLEPLVEIMQHKGDSECRNGLRGVLGEPDEFCEFEKLRDPRDAIRECEDVTEVGHGVNWGCVSRSSFARYALVSGLGELSRIGVNPFQFGFIASTDTHNGTPGPVDEWGFEGAFGIIDATPAQRLVTRQPPGDVRSNPGGLVAVWAEENTRESIFAALSRRETYGTSGPRIRARLFGGWEFGDDLCGAPDLVSQAYEEGVPMGGELPEPGGSAGAPVFVTSALRDPGTFSQPGQRLERIQIIKGWMGDDGQVHQKIYEVASGESTGEVDPTRCVPLASGADSLCGVWRDPDFDPSEPTVYYARVLENPSCRFSTLQCNQLDATDRPDGCSEPSVPKLVQERAWTSPIWYTPPGA